MVSTFVTRYAIALCLRMYHDKKYVHIRYFSIRCTSISVIMRFLIFSQRYNYFLMIAFEVRQNLEVHLNIVDLEDAADAGLAYLVRVEQFELLGAPDRSCSAGGRSCARTGSPRSWSRVSGQPGPRPSASVLKSKYELLSFFSCLMVNG